MRRGVGLRSLAVVGASVLVLLAGCGDDDPSPAGDVSLDGQQPTDDPSTDPSADPSTGPSTDDPSNGAEPQGSSQTPGSRCQTLDEASDGVYDLGDAGELVMERDGETLRLVEVRVADGWRYEEDDVDDDDEVEVTFRSDGREIEFEADVDDGWLDVEVCED